MSIVLEQNDFERLVGILGGMPDFRTAQGRMDFVTHVFAGTPRRDDLIASLNVDGTPQAVAVRFVDRLQTFGQDEPGRETLGVLVNKMLSYLGGTEDARYLRELMTRYPFHTRPTADRGAPDDWAGQESPDQVTEKIIGENTLRDIALLEVALEAAQAVGRVKTSVGVGTGFMAAPGLLVTNNHVIADRWGAEGSVFDFNYQLDRYGAVAPVRSFAARQGGLFYTNAELDFTFIELAGIPLDLPPLVLKAERARKDQRVNIIQHPGGHYKKISMQNNFVAYADERTLQYTTSTEPGSSGAPVFNNAFEVIGIHHSGGMLREPGGRQRYLRNAGTSAIAVLDDVKQNASEIAERLMG
ncbi:trypsin-like peptidase domain-containing protein [Streptomyces coerulescens]|uniref:Serine protease n=1 Tax=Streptomyces coerulescens TaxID=29304 RepID=A0ABW0CXN7_STRCD